MTKEIYSIIWNDACSYDDEPLKEQDCLRESIGYIHEFKKTIAVIHLKDVNDTDNYDYVLIPKSLVKDKIKWRKN